MVSRNTVNNKDTLQRQDLNEVLQKVAKALDGMEYGEVMIKVQGGKVVFVDRYERERVG